VPRQRQLFVLLLRPQAPHQRQLSVLQLQPLVPQVQVLQRQAQQVLRLPLLVALLPPLSLQEHWGCLWLPHRKTNPIRQALAASNPY
jgi:hypothetical protein